MWVYYGISGLVANFVTLINTAMIVAILGSMGATLTLPGIAGIVLTLGMAVRRTHHHLRTDARRAAAWSQSPPSRKPRLRACLRDDSGLERHYSYRRFVLLQYGTGSIRGFALTLLVGIAANVFMATFFFTKALFEFFLEARTNQKPLGMGLSQKDLAEITA